MQNLKQLIRIGCRPGPPTLLCCTGELEKAGIPFTPAVGAIFMWVDLRGALPQPTWEVIFDTTAPGHAAECFLVMTSQTVSSEQAGPRQPENVIFPVGGGEALGQSCQGGSPSDPW